MNFGIGWVGALEFDEDFGGPPNALTGFESIPAICFIKIGVEVELAFGANGRGCEDFKPDQVCGVLFGALLNDFFIFRRCFDEVLSTPQGVPNGGAVVAAIKVIDVTLCRRIGR